MLKRIIAVVLVVVSLSLQSCSGATASLKSFNDNYDGYEFLYPNGWVTATVENGPDIVLHDLIEQAENASVVISPVSDGKTLKDLGTPTEVGYRLSKTVFAPPGANIDVELIDAQERQTGNETYYTLEYLVKLPDRLRHNIASVVVRRGQLFTFNISTSDQRWEKVQKLFHLMADSFSVY